MKKAVSDTEKNLAPNVAEPETSESSMIENAVETAETEPVKDPADDASNETPEAVAEDNEVKTTDATEPEPENMPSIDDQIKPPKKAAKPKITVKRPAKKSLLAREERVEGRIVSANGDLEGNTEERENYNRRVELLASLHSRKILTGTVESVKALENENPYVSFFYGDMTVIIPASEMLEIPKSERPVKSGDAAQDRHNKQILYRRLNSWLTKRISSQIDFIVKGIDNENNLVTASRLEAMRFKRHLKYIKADRDGHFIIEEGKIAEARIVAVNQHSLIVEIQGVESFIAANEVSYARIFDLTEEFNPGDMVLVKILKIEKDSDDNVTVEASVRQAQKNPYIQYSKFYTVGGKYVGTVSGISDTGIFVTLRGGITCLCKFVGRGENPVRGDRVTITLSYKDDEKCRLAGVISHVAASDR